MKTLPALLLALSIPVHAEPARNPILFADVPDQAMIRVGDTYYMSSTTMHLNPGLPLMKSTDLVNWQTIGYAHAALDDAPALNLAPGQQAYGKGSWASSLRHHRGTFYVTTFSGTTGKTYLYRTQDLERGPWTAVSFRPMLHDHSLFFDDDDRAYLVHGNGTLRLVELNANLDGLQPGGLDQVIVPAAYAPASAQRCLAEGSQLFKVNGRYYLFNIVWPRGGMRTVVVHRADKLTGPYEGRVVLQDRGIAQGGLIDTPEGTWFAYLFEDHGAVGRIPYLVPVTWVDGWPVLGTDGKAPDTLDLPASTGLIPGLVDSDEFQRRPGERDLPLAWQWNHNPDPAGWSLDARPGFLRLTPQRTDADLPAARNTLTQRTFGPTSSATTLLDATGLKPGDCAGLALLQQRYGWIGVMAEEGSNRLVMVSGTTGAATVVQSVPLAGASVHLRADCDFRERADTARFFYSLDGQTWQPLGEPLKMIYTIPHFMGYRFGLFSFATRTPGGHADFDFFRIGPAGVSDVPGTGARTTQADPPPNPRAALNRPVVLAPDDRPVFPEPPAGFDGRRADIPHGRLELIEYDSKTVGTRRRMQVYTPPGYSTERKYPVLYLLHGIGGNEHEWQHFATPDVLLDNLIADGKAVPMIVVMPNGRAQKDDRPVGDVFAAAPAFAVFERDLLDDVIPAIEARYSTYTDREHRALAGLSMGGGQTLNFGFAHLDTFAWLGGFSSAPNTKPPAVLVPDPDQAKRMLRLLWLSCGNRDGLINISQGLHTYLKEKGVPHLWHVDGNGHDAAHWRNALYYFAQRIFQPPAATPPATTTLRAAFADRFLVGAALDRSALTPGSPRAELAAREFSSLTAENDMKWALLHPAPGRFAFDAADAYVDFAQQHRMAVIGHTLVWHSQTPRWVFADETGQPATREVVLARMREHIQTVVGRYRGRVKGWDVVNEAVADGGPATLRDSPWTRSIGDDFLDHAFRAAHEADPAAELYYNDYGLEHPQKRARALTLLRGLLDRGVPLTGVGLQGHYHLEQPPLAVIEQTIKDFAALGLKVMITELDVDVLPTRGPMGNADIARRESADPALDPYRDGLPAAVQEQLTQRYADLFALFLRHRDAITRVTFWGMDDGHTWLNHYPIRGRVNHPLLFDRALAAKPAHAAVLRVAGEPVAAQRAP